MIIYRLALFCDTIMYKFSFLQIQDVWKLQHLRYCNFLLVGIFICIKFLLPEQSRSTATGKTRNILSHFRHKRNPLQLSVDNTKNKGWPQNNVVYALMNRFFIHYTVKITFKPFPTQVIFLQ